MIPTSVFPVCQGAIFAPCASLRNLKSVTQGALADVENGVGTGESVTMPEISDLPSPFISVSP